ncbi:PEP-CTERM sorting domain-containing protein [Roseateles sp.]|uniref:PEP-CTERM sorting domain-containing protein n=1 Tax=Roseateles sp. TaxID=1971397 RepID=UPI002687C090
MNKTVIALALGAAALAPSAQAAAFKAGDIAIYRVGTGGSSLSSAATAVFIDEYTTNGTLVQSIALPTLANGASFALTASGTATSEGLMTLSADGKSLVLTGYNAAVGTAGVASSTAASVTRVVGVVGANGSVNTTTGLGNNFDKNNIRSAVSTDGNQLWVAGATTGVVATTVGSTGNGTVVSSTVTNNRQLEIFNGQIYVGNSSGNGLHYATIGAGTPTNSGNVMNALPGLPTGTNASSPYAFFMADLNPNVAGLDTLYVADDGLNGNGGLQKYSFNGTTWSLKGTVGSAATLRGLTGSVNANGSVSLFAVGGGGSGPTGGGVLYGFTDVGAATSTLSGSLTTLATAANNTAFRGVALAPIPEPQTYALMLSGLLAVAFMARRRRG